MTETHTIHDPFLDKQIEISSRLCDRLRGKYANGPTMPNGEPEFGWRQFETPPIQHEAAAEIERLREELESAQAQITIAKRSNGFQLLGPSLPGCLHPGNEPNSCQHEGKCLSLACNHNGKTWYGPRMTLEAQVDGILYPGKDS